MKSKIKKYRVRHMGIKVVPNKKRKKLDKLTKQEYIKKYE